MSKPPKKTRERNKTARIDELERMYMERVMLLSLRRLKAPRVPDDKPSRVHAPKNQAVEWTKRFRTDALAAYRRAMEFWLRARIADCDDVLHPKPPPQSKRPRSLFEWSDVEEDETWDCF